MGGMPYGANDDFFGAQLTGGTGADQNRDQVNQIYQQYLGRDLDPGAFEAHWKNSKGNLDVISNAVQNSPEAQAYAARTRTADNPGAYPGTGGTVIQPDLYGLRNVLGGFLQDQIVNWKAQPYGGNLEAQTDPLFGDAASMYRTGVEKTNADLDSFYGGLNPLRSLADNGGAPDISAALENIRQRGLMDIQDQSAQIREKFGRMGLGQSSDIAEYLGRGTSRGIADINQQQSTLLASIMDSAANRRLSAAQGLSTSLGSGAAIRSSSYQGAAGGLANIGAQSQAVRENNLARQYADFVRMQQPNPYISDAAGYAGNFAPVKPVIPEQNSNWLAGLLGALGPIGGALIGMSDRNLKENIEETPASEVVAAMTGLPIYRWNYKGDKTPHIGPMAQDFQKAFGAGDGKTIHLVDVMGVLLASQKAVMERFANA